MMQTIELTEIEKRTLSMAIHRAIRNSETYIKEKEETLSHLNYLNTNKYHTDQHGNTDYEIAHCQGLIDGEKALIENFKKLFEKIHNYSIDEIPF